MKKLTTTLCALVAAACAAAAPLLQPDFADAGAVTNIVFAASPMPGAVMFSLEFAPSPTNNVEIALGTDADGDGDLSATGRCVCPSAGTAADGLCGARTPKTFESIRLRQIGWTYESLRHRLTPEQRASIVHHMKSVLGRLPDEMKRDMPPAREMIANYSSVLLQTSVSALHRTSEVSVETSNLTHLHPGDTAQLAAVVTNCHADAYLGCTWHGGAVVSNGTLSVTGAICPTGEIVLDGADVSGTLEVTSGSGMLRRMNGVMDLSGIDLDVKSVPPGGQTIVECNGGFTGDFASVSIPRTNDLLVPRQRLVSCSRV